MELSIKSGHPEKQRTACVVAGVYEPRRLSAVAEKIDKASDGYLSNLLRRGDIEGKLGQVLLLHNIPGSLADRVLLIGCGRERDLSDQQYHTIITKAVQTLNETGSMEAVSFLTELNVKGRDIAWRVRHAVQISLSCLYTFTSFKSSKDNLRRPLRKIVFNVPTRKELTLGEKAMQEGMAIAKGTSLTRDLGNTPPNICTPSYLAEQALELSKSYNKISTVILDEDEIQKLNMNLFLSVTAGSKQPAKLITMTYKGNSKKTKPIVIVGKGITFDTGGNSLKAPKSMVGMKYDMCGAAAVFGTLKAIAELDLPVSVIGVIPTCENMIGGNATRPDDVITSMSGQTVEIANTDAEGRLILADALTYVERFDPEAVVDIATLTGACLIALGHHASGLMSNHQPLAHELLNAGTISGDKAWQLPLWDEYADYLKSAVADMSNAASPPVAGTIAAGMFLSKFSKKYHWAHLDVAGTALDFINPQSGASGRPVPLLVQFIINKIESNKG